MSQQMIALLIFLFQHNPGLFADADSDGYRNLYDCDDSNRAVNPGMAESCYDEFDNNCDGNINEGCGGDA